jgi:hypothetical protein
METSDAGDLGGGILTSPKQGGGVPRWDRQDQFVIVAPGQTGGEMIWTGGTSSVG